jgi:hypothetical protein
MSERKRKPMEYPFLVAVLGLLIAVLLDRVIGTVIFCLAGIYVTVSYVVLAIKLQSGQTSERVWNLGVAAVFAVFTYLAATTTLSG